MLRVLPLDLNFSDFQLSLFEFSLARRLAAKRGLAFVSSDRSSYSDVVLLDTTIQLSQIFTQSIDTIDDRDTCLYHYR